jgi:hypothetical protein
MRRALHEDGVFFPNLPRQIDSTTTQQVNPRKPGFVTGVNKQIRTSSTADEGEIWVWEKKLKTILGLIG